MSLEKLYIKQKRVIIERKNIESVHCRRRWTHGVVSTLHLIKTTDCFITTRESFYSCSDALPTAPGFPAVAGLPAFDRQNDVILHDCSRPKTKKIKNLISLHSFRSSCSRSKRLVLVHCRQSVPLPTASRTGQLGILCRADPTSLVSFR